MVAKECSDCKKNKNVSEFYQRARGGAFSYCKDCSNIRSKNYHYKNKIKINERSRNYAETNKANIREQRLTKKEKLNEYQRNYARNRYKIDPVFKFKKSIRRSTSEAFGSNKKSKKTIELLGCSMEIAFCHIESLFQPGMTWDNYGSEWHIDHIIPLASAETIEETEKLCHYSNLQPLWALENVLKSDKLDWKPSSDSLVLKGQT